MSRHVILLTDAHEAPAYELIEALRLAGVKTLIEGLREARAVAPVARPVAESVDDIWGQLPLAVLYEVFPGLTWSSFTQPSSRQQLHGQAHL